LKLILSRYLFKKRQNIKAYPDLSHYMKGVYIEGVRHGHDEIKQITILLRQLFYYKKVKLIDVRESLKKKTVLVAKHNGRIIGMISFGFFFNDLLGHIKEVIVDKDYRGKGIGRKLLKKAMLCIAKNNACKMLFLISGMKRKQAHKLYFKNNFKRIVLFTGIFYKRVNARI
jgi:GNAT superfamily N-acetyltransferase